MSGTQAAGDDGDGVPSQSQDDDEVERIARANGWKPKEDFRDQSKWVPAAVFVARGLDNPAILADRNNTLSRRLDELQRASATEGRELRGRLDTALESLNAVTQMTRSAETRAYDRARRELREQAATAVSNADTVAYQRAQTELDELDRTKPAPAPPSRPDPVSQPVNPGPPPAAAAFFSRNPWYQQDSELQMEADIIHTGLSTKRPELSLEQNLAEVERRMKAQFPDRVGAPRRPPARQENDDPDDDPPGRQTVTASSAAAVPRRATGRRTFDAMPKEAKDAYAKYAKLLEGKGAPFTKEEYSTNYWDQFQDDGA